MQIATDSAFLSTFKVNFNMIRKRTARAKIQCQLSVLQRSVQPLTRLSFCRRSLSITVDTPTKGRGGVQQTDRSLVNGSRSVLTELRYHYEELDEALFAMEVLNALSSTGWSNRSQ